jgi:DNA-binding response OmpR family regulator
MSGLEILRHLRIKGDPLPVLILTARDTVSDRIKGLDGGADDYLAKPFDLDELSARLRAISRRSSGRAAPLSINGPVTLDPAAHKVSLDGKPLELSPREYALLELFMENAGTVLTKSRLEQTLYGWTQDVESGRAIRPRAADGCR